MIDEFDESVTNWTNDGPNVADGGSVIGKRLMNLTKV
jgi:hypothetical protein